MHYKILNKWQNISKRCHLVITIYIWNRKIFKQSFKIFDAIIQIIDHWTTGIIDHWKEGCLYTSGIERLLKVSQLLCLDKKGSWAVNAALLWCGLYIYIFLKVIIWGLWLPNYYLYRNSSIQFRVVAKSQLLLHVTRWKV